MMASIVWSVISTEPALHESDMVAEGFRWISCDDSLNSVYAYIRQGNAKSDFLVIVVNFTPLPRYDYKIGVPTAGFYSELLNTDAGCYGGSSVGNAGGVYSLPGVTHGQPQHISLTLPPLGMLILKPVTAATPAMPAALV
jgi:1,4-alpha-glucan branching enzyme